jgi:hypothetical protein
MSDPTAELAALDALLAADRLWLAQLAQARTVDQWDALLAPAWGPPPGDPEGRA